MLWRSPEPVSGSDSSEKEHKSGMPSGSLGDKQHWSEKMEREAITIECLRGRLLAERSTSKAAREEADLMGKKLIELERKLKLEMESRNRAEKKLKYATKKLQSLKLSAILKQSGSPETSEGTSSSSAVSSGLGEQEEKQTPTSPKQNMGGCNADQKTMRAAEAALNAENSKANRNSAPNSDQSSDSKESIGKEEVGRMMDDPRQSSKDGDEPGREQGENSDPGKLSLAIVPASNSSPSDLSLVLVPPSDSSESSLSLAIVPAGMHPELKVCEPKFNNQCQLNNDIRDVLVALQHAKEQLQTSMERMARQSCSYELCGV